MSTGRNRVHRRRAVVLAFLAVAFPAWVLAQHGMGRESDDMLSDHEATRSRELVEMCEGIVMTQTEEIRQMQAWLCDWYDICGYGPGGDDAAE